MFIDGIVAGEINLFQGALQTQGRSGCSLGVCSAKSWPSLALLKLEKFHAGVLCLSLW